MDKNDIFHQLEEFATGVRITKEVRVIAKEEYAAGFEEAKELAIAAVRNAGPLKGQGTSWAHRLDPTLDEAIAAIRAIEPEMRS